MKIESNNKHYFYDKIEIDSCKNCIYKNCAYYGDKKIKCDKYIKGNNNENRINN